MKSKTKVLATSLTTIALSAALIGGSTYALFTSQANAGISVTSGKVEVVATARIEKAWSGEDMGGLNETVNYKLDEYTDEETGYEGYQFTNKGTVVYNDDDNKVILDKITPGDGVELKVNIQNNSNVAINYTVYTLLVDAGDKALYDALDTKYTYPTDGQAVEGANGWYKLDAEEQLSEEVTVTLELPDADNNNDYQDAHCEVAIIVEAVQGNAHVGAAVSDDDIQDFLANANVVYDTTTNAMGAKQYVKSLDVKTAKDLMVFAYIMNNEHELIIGEDAQPGLGVGRDWRTTVNLAAGAEFDLEGYTWAPMKGTNLIINGNGATIKNLNMGKGDAKWGGFIGSGDNTEIHDLTFENVTVSGAQVGVLIGHSSGTVQGATKITNITLKGNINISYTAGTTEDWDAVGVFVGVHAEEWSAADNCVVDADAVVTLNLAGANLANKTLLHESTYWFGYLAGGTFEVTNFNANGVVYTVNS